MDASHPCFLHPPVKGERPREARQGGIPLLFLISNLSFLILLSACGKPAPPPEKPLQPAVADTTTVIDTVAAPVTSDIDSVWTELSEGLYLNTSASIDSARLHDVLQRARDAGIDNICFDVKTMRGDVNIRLPQRDDLLPHRTQGLIDLAKLTETLHSYGMRASARLVMFHDTWLAAQRPDLRPFREPGVPWSESEERGPAWLDPSRPEVQDDLLALIDIVAASGVDEVQMDYVRFPTQGAIDDAWFAFEWGDWMVLGKGGRLRTPDKSDVIAAFVKRARQVCDSHGVELTADVFAIVLWGRAVDIAQTGQDLRKMTPWLHRVHPMIYSSHFAHDFGHRDDVPNEPYQIVFDGVRRCRELTDDRCRVIPYLQAMTWDVDYSPAYVIAQIQATRAAGGDGYIFWSPASHYTNCLDWLRTYKQHGAR